MTSSFPECCATAASVLLLPFRVVPTLADTEVRPHVRTEDTEEEEEDMGAEAVTEEDTEEEGADTATATEDRPPATGIPVEGTETEGEHSDFLLI